MDTSHLDALELGRLHEAQRLARAATEAERALRTVWVAQYERQIVDEKARLGIASEPDELSDAEMLAELAP